MDLTISKQEARILRHLEKAASREREAISQVRLMWGEGFFLAEATNAYLAARWLVLEGDDADLEAVHEITVPRDVWKDMFRGAVTISPADGGITAKWEKGNKITVSRSDAVMPKMGSFFPREAAGDAQWSEVPEKRFVGNGFDPSYLSTVFSTLSGFPAKVTPRPVTFHDVNPERNLGPVGMRSITTASLAPLEPTKSYRWHGVLMPVKL